jgi:hypothetical protein
MTIFSHKFPNSSFIAIPTFDTSNKALLNYPRNEDGCLIALMLEATRTSETLVNFYQTTRRYSPEESHLRTHRREYLKSYYPRNNKVDFLL